MEDFMYKDFYELEDTHWWFVGRKKIALDFISKYACSKKLKILDAGCGCGVMLNSLAAYGEAYGLDISPIAVSYCKNVFGGCVKEGSLEDEMPDGFGGFDLVTALDVLEHIDDESAAIKGIYSALSDNGIALVTVPAFNFLWSKHDEVNRHKRRYTLKELTNKLKERRFKVLKCSYFNSFLFIPVLVVRTIQKIAARVNMGGGGDEPFMERKVPTSRNSLI